MKLNASAGKRHSGGTDGKAKALPKGVYYTGFSALKIAMKYKDPVEQAEYAYSRIRNEVSS